MAVLDGLTEKLSAIVGRMRGKTRISEQDLKNMMREIRLALLEADVHYQVVKDLIEEISEKANGQDVLASLTPGQQIVKIVHSALVDILGNEISRLAVSPTGFTVFMLYGLQGAGKTTTAAKMALMLKKKGKKPLLTSVDVHRPAAARQLDILAHQIDVPCFIQPEQPDAVEIAEKAVARARYLMCDTLIVDTAGRMSIDKAMMQELKAIAQVVKPTEKLLIVDAMIGQEAVGVATSFEQDIGLDGFIMTKLDGDARGGAALSIRRMTGKPIKLVCVGEKVEDIEEFHPDRLASRILGMGDVMSLIEKATSTMDEQQTRKSAERLMNNQFTLEDMLTQLTEVRKMGSMQDLLGMLPGGLGRQMAGAQIDEKAMDYQVAILRSMTRRERNNPTLLNASRRKRIAAGSGTTVQDVNRLVRQYEETQKMMKQFTKKGKKGRGMGRMPGFGSGSGFPF
ncbi:MAG: signal recognition particle protein [Ruminococcaceae bacterium]|jgi:signal recognition particle subunit SRP54|nr:signal recognition particle protein [Oscillospiraceae bacterium]